MPEEQQIPRLERIQHYVFSTGCANSAEARAGSRFAGRFGLSRQNTPISWQSKYAEGHSL
jgi:hypothetical protein